MKKFFEEHGGVAIILIVIAVLLVLVGSVKGLDEGTGKVNGSGIASIVGNAYFNAIDKFKDSFDNVLSGTGNSNNSNPTSGPNGEPLVSTTESQVGKYADIDGDGTVFADLMVGGSGQFGNSDGAYSIPTISSSKDYYVSQESYTNVLGGTAEVLTSTGSGNDRFYIMALNDVSSNPFTWYASASFIPDWDSVTNYDFGKGKSNTNTMISKWNNKVYGDPNGASYTDMWDVIQTHVNNGWFVPSSKEWAAFNKQLGITDSNHEDKGLYSGYWSSSLYSYNQPVLVCSGSCLSNLGFRYKIPVRLAATF